MRVQLFFAGRTVAGFSLGALSAGRPDLAGDALRQTVELVVGGSVRAEVNTMLPLEQAVRAHHRVESGATIGKTVLAVS
ncbi:zinc-binding dehydrogenase [Nocardia sp. NPDC059228]|uniref:zinc-binding dehydrogenase n=1 Tax=Nocardia sp. NPDC059228 TaxID=3346777 RepID=UPI0036862DA0